MNFSGIITGVAVFLIIGICHPIVIKMEYYWGKRSWWVLLLVGLCFAAASLFTRAEILSTILGAAAFCFPAFGAFMSCFRRKRGCCGDGSRRILPVTTITKI